MSNKIEFGDFQTPQALADRICQKLQQEGVNPSLIVEPTCGHGNFLDAAKRKFSETCELQGFEINGHYVEKARERFANSNSIKIYKCDVMQETIFPQKNFPKNCLIIGNPPWITNSRMGRIGGANLPKKII